MDERVYWIWLSEALYPGSRKIKEIYKAYKSAKKFYEMGEMEWRLFGMLTQKEINRLIDYDISEAEEILNKCAFLGIDIITLSEDLYPQRLKEIDNPPATLYVKGTMPRIDDTVCIAMVGTRNATSYGVDMAFDLSYSLAKLGAIIVSGGAIGIDTASHKGALQAEGKTVLVMGCGLNYSYLPENLEMRRQVKEQGVLMSEYPPDMPPIRSNFPMRNRIISGLSNGTVVVEAGSRSGSLITANMTLDQGRDLFAVPGNITSEVSKGTNNLLKECAKPVTNALDIMEEYLPQVDMEEFKQSTEQDEQEQENKAKELVKGVSANGQKLYAVLTAAPVHADVLVEKLDFSVNDMLIAATELEITGLLKKFPGNLYARAK